LITRSSLFVLAVSLLLTPPLTAQQASEYLSLDHWSYPALELWIARGDITTLSPFTRPYRAEDVRRAVQGVDESGLTTNEARIRRRIIAELTAPTIADTEQAGRLTFGLEAGGRFVTQTHPDPLQAVLDGEFGDARVLERLELRASGASRYVAGAVRLRRDGIYSHDPRFPEGQVTSRRDGLVVDDLSMRLEEAYVELQIPFFRFGIGRMDRNWGPAGMDGFIRSTNPYSEDELSYRIGNDRVFLIGSIATPSDFGADTVRHLSMHRLEVRPSDRVAFAVSEAVVHGGPGGRFRFALANPVGIWQIALDESKVPHNKLGQVDLWWSAARGVVLTGSLLADATNREGSCCQMGGSFGVELANLGSELLVRGRVTFIQSLAYRTELPWEEYSLSRVGIGWDKADVLLATVSADWLATPSLRISPRLDLQKLGEGDFRQLRPPPEDLPDLPRLLLGVTETTVRPALAGSFTRLAATGIYIDWDVGLSVISNYGNIEGADRTEVTGSVGVRVAMPEWGISLR
jgi:hypothetical protein